MIIMTAANTVRPTAASLGGVAAVLLLPVRWSVTIGTSLIDGTVGTKPGRTRPSPDHTSGMRPDAPRRSVVKRQRYKGHPTRMMSMGTSPETLDAGPFQEQVVGVPKGSAIAGRWSGGPASMTSFVDRSPRELAVS